jgi:hypothetical protein
MTFSSDKEKYGKFGKSRADWPIFMQNWWLDAVSEYPENWSCRIAASENGQLEAAMPFFVEKKWGFSKTTHPPLTPWLGCWIADAPEGSKMHSKLARERFLIENLLQNRPTTDLFDVNFSPEFTNSITVQMAGFRQTTRYSWQISDLTDWEKTLRNFNRNVRRNLEKTADFLKIEPSDDLELLHFLSKKTFQRFGSEIPFSLNLLKKVDFSLKTNANRQLFIARTIKNEPIGAIYFCWNEKKADVLISASDPKFKEIGTLIPLIFEGLDLVKNKTEIFDFNGSMTESVAAVYRSFGANPVAYSRFFRAKNRLLEAAYLMKSF